MWVTTIGYFLLCACALVLAFYIYAQLLLRIARFGWLVRLGVGLLAYVGLAGAFFLPLAGFYSLTQAGLLPELEAESSLVLIIWLASVVPSLFFLKRYLPELKRAGYFKNTFEND